MRTSKLLAPGIRSSWIPPVPKTAGRQPLLLKPPYSCASSRLARDQPLCSIAIAKTIVRGPSAVAGTQKACQSRNLYNLQLLFASTGFPVDFEQQYDVIVI